MKASVVAFWGWKAKVMEIQAITAQVHHEEHKDCCAHTASLQHPTTSHVMMSCSAAEEALVAVAVPCALLRVKAQGTATSSHHHNNRREEQAQERFLLAAALKKKQPAAAASPLLQR